MWIICKYTLKSIGEKKFRTFLVILAISLAGALFLASNELSDNIAKIYEEQIKEGIGNVEITVTPDKNSPSSFINEKLCKDLEKEGSLVVPKVSGSGAYKVEGQQYDSISLLGYNLEDYRAINKLVLLEERDLEPFVGNKMIISEKTAAKYELKLGDDFTLKINGVRRKLSIVGIAVPKGIFAREGQSSTGMMPMETLSKYIGGNGKGNQIYIQCAEGKDSMTVLGEVKKIYPRYKVEETFDTESFKAQMAWMIQPFMLMTLVVVFISGFIIYSTFKVIMLEKLPIVGTFRSIGASKSKMTGVLLIEALCYGMIGGVLALVLGGVMLSILSKGLMEGDSGHTAMTVKGHTLVMAFFFSVGVALLSTILPILSVSKISLKDIVLGNRPHKSRKYFKSTLMGVSAIAIGYTICQVQEAGVAIICSILGLFLVIVGIMKILPILVLHLSRLLEVVFSAVFGNIGNLAVKNIRKNKSVLNSITLITLGMAVLLLVSTITQNLQDQIIKIYDTTYKCEIDASIEKLDDQKVRKFVRSEGVKSVTKTMQADAECEALNGFNLSIMAVEDTKINEFVDMKIQGNPEEVLRDLQEGRNVIVAKNIAKKYKVKIGDSLHIQYNNNKSKAYEVIGIMDTVWNNGSLCMLPIKYYRVDAEVIYYDSILAKIQEGYKVEAVMSELEKNFKDEITNIQSVEMLKDADSKSNESLMDMISIFALLAMIIGMVGIVNNLMISFIERRKSLAVLRSLGMSKRQLLQMIFIEALGSGLIGGVGGILAGLVIMKEMDYVLDALSMPITVEPVFALFGIYFVGAAVITIIGSILPARGATQLNIVAAIKFE